MKETDNSETKVVEDNDTHDQTNNTEKVTVDDPYRTAVDDEAVAEYYNQLTMGSIPEHDQSFEFEPNFEPKNLEEYTRDPEKEVVYLKEFPTYTKELDFHIKGKFVFVINRCLPLGKSACEQVSLRFLYL